MLLETPCGLTAVKIVIAPNIQEEQHFKPEYHMELSTAACTLNLSLLKSKMMFRQIQTHLDGPSRSKNTQTLAFQDTNTHSKPMG